MTYNRQQPDGLEFRFDLDGVANPLLAFSGHAGRVGFQEPLSEDALQRFEHELNERQIEVIRRMFEAGPEGFTGDINARKYVALTGSSKATATRDLQHLARLGALASVGGGRSTRYEFMKI